MDGTLELACRFDDMIGRHDEHDGVGVLACDECGAQADTSCRIAATRFANDAVVRECGKLAGDLRAMGCGSNDPRSLRGRLGLDTVQRLLKEGAVAYQGEELFGFLGAAARPKASAAAAGQRDRMKHEKLRGQGMSS